MNDSWICEVHGAVNAANMILRATIDGVGATTPCDAAVRAAARAGSVWKALDVGGASAKASAGKTISDRATPEEELPLFRVEVSARVPADKATIDAKIEVRAAMECAATIKAGALLGRALACKLEEIEFLEVEVSELKEIKKKVEARLPRTHWLMICGSIQPGIPPHYYCEIIEMAKSHGVKTLLDTDGEALQHALEAKPTVIMPNQHEAERLLSRALITRGQFLEAVHLMQAMGPENVILSLGARGAIGSSPEGVFEAMPPRIEALCPIGAGDALGAAFAWSMEKKKSFSEALRWGVATGTAAAKLPGLSFPTFNDARAVYKQVELRQAH